MQIFFVHNPKGGVGKSMVCITFIQYLIALVQSFIAFDTDRNNPDVYRRYKNDLPVKLAIFSESTRFEDSANEIFNIGITQNVVVNLPAQVHQPLWEWFEKNDLLTLAKEIKLTFHFLFVTDAGFDSLNLLQKTLETYQDKVRYTIIRNYGRADDFDALAAHKEIQKLAKQYRAVFMDFPALIGSIGRNRLDAESLSFQRALESDAFTLIDKQRIRKFLKEAYNAFDTAGVLHERDARIAKRS